MFNCKETVNYISSVTDGIFCNDMKNKYGSYVETWNCYFSITV